jgi:serine/threonine protein kinase
LLAQNAGDEEFVAMPFVVGENVGPYRLIEQLGQGGMATVFKAYHPALDRHVAIKALHPAFMHEPNFLARFRREAQVVARLEHPNIVPIYDYSEHEGRPYLVMKFIQGETLKARLSRGALPQGEIGRIVESVGAALSYAHEQGVLHRDVKPSNILLANDGRIYLADFGLARMADAGESTLSSDVTLGTPQYISPEQALGAKDLDQATDIYSFGVVLYELYVGRTPFNADTPYSVIHDHIYSPLPIPHQINPQVSEAVERVLFKALAKARSDRFATIDEFVAAWKQAVQSGTTEVSKPQKSEQDTGVQAAADLSEFPQGPHTAIISETQVRAALSGAEMPADVTVDKAMDSAPAIAKEGQGYAAVTSPPVQQKVKKTNKIGFWALIGIVGVCICLGGGLAVVRSRDLNRQAQLAFTATNAPTMPLSEASAYPNASISASTPSLRQTAVAGFPLRSTLFPNAYGAPPVPLATAQYFVSTQPDNPLAHVDLALAYWAASKPLEARKEMEQALKLTDSPETLALDVGNLMRERKLWLLAATFYLEAASRSPQAKNPELEQLTMQTVYLAAQWPESKELLWRLPLNRFGEGLVELFRARYVFYNGVPLESRNALRLLKKSFPNLREAALLEAETAFKEGETEEAISALKKLSADPSYPLWVQWTAQALLQGTNP